MSESIKTPKKDQINQPTEENISSQIENNEELLSYLDGSDDEKEGFTR